MIDIFVIKCRLNAKLKQNTINTNWVTIDFFVEWMTGHSHLGDKHRRYKNTFRSRINEQNEGYSLLKV